MTPEEKQAQKMERDAKIIEYYQAGHKLSQCASHFQLGRQRVQKILKKAGVWTPYVKTSRTQFLGITVTEPTKQALKDAAKEQGVSMSQFASDVLEAAINEDQEPDHERHQPSPDA